MMKLITFYSNTHRHRHINTHRGGGTRIAILVVVGSRGFILWHPLMWEIASFPSSMEAEAQSSQLTAAHDPPSCAQ
jgi:hypothetical protein